MVSDEKRTDSFTKTPKKGGYSCVNPRFPLYCIVTIIFTVGKYALFIYCDKCNKEGRGVMFLLLLAFWVLLNGRITAEIMILGVVICGVIYGWCVKVLGLDPKRELRYVRRIPGAIKYLLILVVEVIRAAIDVMLLTLSPKSREVKASIPRWLTSSSAAAIISSFVNFGLGGMGAPLSASFVLHRLF